MRTAGINPSLVRRSSVRMETRRYTAASWRVSSDSIGAPRFEDSLVIVRLDGMRRIRRRRLGRSRSRLESPFARGLTGEQTYELNQRRTGPPEPPLPQRRLLICLGRVRLWM